MNNFVNELENKMSNLSVNDLDNMINRMEKMKITNRRDNKVDDLMNSMNSLKIVPANKQMEVAIRGVTKYRNNKFNGIYRSLKGKKSKALSQNQINDIFATMDALKR